MEQAGSRCGCLKREVVKKGGANWVKMRVPLKGVKGGMGWHPLTNYGIKAWRRGFGLQFFLPLIESLPLFQICCLFVFVLNFFLLLFFFFLLFILFFFCYTFTYFVPIGDIENRVTKNNFQYLNRNCD